MSPGTGTTLGDTYAYEDSFSSYPHFDSVAAAWLLEAEITLDVLMVSVLFQLAGRPSQHCGACASSAGLARNCVRCPQIPGATVRPLA
jgi:hypothetical protein